MKKKVLFILALLCTVAQGAWAESHEAIINNGKVDINENGDWLITGNGETTSNQIEIHENITATVTLRDVKISNTAWCILCNGNATIILADGTTNTLTCTTSTSSSTYHAFPAIWVGDNGKVTIQGTGTLTAQGGDGCAAIGGGYNNNMANRTCGDIEIQGGIINATGGANAPGIGADYEGSCGNITISGGTITATGGVGAAGIGSGRGESTAGNIADISRCGNITITNGVTRVTAIKGSDAVHCIGKGANENYSFCGTVTINGIEYWKVGEYQNDGEYQKDGATYLSQNKLTVANINSGSVNPDGATGNAKMQADELWLVIGNGDPTTNQIWITDGATVALSNVNISNTAFDICCRGNATVILAEGTTNTLISTGTSSDLERYPALWVGNSGKTLTIQGKGSLTAQGGYGRAGIGGGYNNNKICGDIVIEGGIIEATGGAYAAGIGADFDGICGNITINRGTITATGGIYAAGIGCGGDGMINSCACGNITITNGVTRVTATKDSDAVHCIGKGGDESTCGTVTINGIEYWDGSAYKKDGDTYLSRDKLTVANINSGSVNPDGATGNAKMQSNELWLVIGNGDPTTNQIWITDGATVALSNVNISNEAFDICCTGYATVILAEGTTNTLISTGTGQNAYPALWVGNSGKTLTIQGKGSLKAQGGYGCAGIGGGYNNNNKICGDIVIEGGIIEAKGGTYAPGIGADDMGSCGNITITNGVTLLIATKGSDIAHCIGRSNGSSSCGVVTIGGVEYWRYGEYKNSGANYIGKDALAYLKGNEGATGQYWTTFYNTAVNNFQAVGETKVFKVHLDGTTLTLGEIQKGIVNSGVGSGVGVVLKSTSPNFFLTSTDDTAGDNAYDGNSLTGTASTITNPGNAYVLNNGNAGVGFYKLSASGTIGAHKAYLISSTSGGAREFFLFEDDDATGIDMPRVLISDTDAVVYDLQGRRVQNPTKGLYIVNGKKVVIK